MADETLTVYELRTESRAWWVMVLAGIAAVVFGVVVFFDLMVAVTTLALVLAVFLLFAGIVEIAFGQRARAWVRWLIGGVLVAGGVVAVAWPDRTVRVVAVVFGLTIVLSGLLRLFGAFLLPSEERAGPLALAVLSIVVGIVLTVWPEVTVFVVAVLVGIWAVLAGMLWIGLGLRLRPR